MASLQPGEIDRRWYRQQPWKRRCQSEELDELDELGELDELLAGGVELVLLFEADEPSPLLLELELSELLDELDEPSLLLVEPAEPLTLLADDPLRLSVL